MMLRSSRLARVAPLVVLALILLARVADSQERLFEGWDRIEEDDFVFDPDESEVAIFAIQVSGEVRFRFHTARELMKVGNFRRAAEPLQEIINLFPNHLLQVAERPPRWVGAAEYARFLLASFPPEGREEYAQWASLRVASRFEQAIEWGDEELLAELADRWSVTPEGQKALSRLGDLAQERGNHELAERYYRRRLLFEDPPTEAAPEIAFRAAAALGYQGRTQAAAALLTRSGAREIRLAGRRLTVEQALDRFERLDRPEAPEAPERSESKDWPVFGGTPDHAGLLRTNGRPLTFATEWHVPAFSTPSRNPFSFRAAHDTREFPFHAAVAGQSILLADGLRVRSFTFFSQEPRWVFEGPLVGLPPGSDHYRFEDYASDSRERRIGSLAGNLPLMATVAGGMVLCPLFDLRQKGRSIRFDNTDITPAIPSRSLYALDLETGALLWRQRRPELEPVAFVNRISIAAPPIVVGDRVIAAGYILEGAINHYVACFSLWDGRLLWKTPIVVGQQELTMFNKPFKEFTVQMPAERDGSVFVCTNLGLMAALDLLTGNLRWVSQYESIPIRGSRHYTRPLQRDTTSNNDAPVVSDGVAVFSPLDSVYFYGIDAATGKRLWTRSANEGGRHSNGYKYLLGVDQGAVVLGGEYGIGIFDLKTGTRLAEYSFGAIKNPRPWGRGGLGPGTVYQPLFDQLLSLQWTRQPFGVDLSAKLIKLPEQRAGNLVLHDDFQITVSQDSMAVFFDVDALVEEARRKLASGVQTAEDLVRLGDLEHLRGNDQAAVEAFNRVLEQEYVAEELERRVRDGLYQSHRQLALAEDDPEQRLLHLEAQARFAVDARDFLATAEQILEVHEAAGNDEEYLKTLDWIDERHAEVDFPFSKYWAGGLVRAGLFTLERRSLVAMAQGHPAKAVAAWQQMILRYGELPFEGTTAALYAERKIAQAIDDFGAGSYAPFEEQSRELHRIALEARDSRALADLIQRYPNSREVTARRLDLARLLIEQGEQGQAFTVVAPLLSGRSEDDDHVHALYLSARGADLAGDSGLARALYERVRTLGGDLAVLGGEGESYGTLAAAALDRIGADSAPEPGPALLPALPDLSDANEPEGQFALDLDLDPNTHLVPIEGARPDSLADAVLVYELAPAEGSESAWLRLIDVRRLEERWRVPIDSYYSESDPLRAHLFGERLVLRQRKTLWGFDPKSGTVLFERALPAVPSLEVPGPNLFYMQWGRPDGLSEIVAIELAAGNFFWSHTSQELVFDLIEGGDLLLFLTAEGALEALDGLTGASRYSISLLEIARGTKIRAFEEFGLLVATGLGLGETKASLLGFDLGDGRPLFDLDSMPGGLGVSWLSATSRGLVLLRGEGIFGGGSRTKGIHAVELLEPRTGRLLEQVTGLPQLEEFDHGRTVLDGKAVLLAGTGSRRRPEQRRLVVIDLVRQVERSVPLDALPNATAEFTSFATRDGGVFGTIDIRPAMPKRYQSFVFSLETDSGDLKLVRVPSSHDYRWSSATTTADALVVLKEGRLHVYRAASNGAPDSPTPRKDAK